MKRLLILILLVLAGCGDREPEQAATGQNREEIITQVYATGMITDQQAEFLGKFPKERFGKNPEKYNYLELNGLAAITDQQADSLGKVRFSLYLNGLTSITDDQINYLSEIPSLNLSGLVSITDHQVEILSTRNEGLTLELNKLSSLTDSQAESLSKVKALTTPEHLQPLIDKSKKQ